MKSSLSWWDCLTLFNLALMWSNVSLTRSNECGPPKVLFIRYEQLANHHYKDYQGKHIIVYNTLVPKFSYPMKKKLNYKLILWFYNWSVQTITYPPLVICSGYHSFWLPIAIYLFSPELCFPFTSATTRFLAASTANTFFNRLTTCLTWCTSASLTHISHPLSIL